MKTKRIGKGKSILFLVLFTLFIGIFTFGGIQGFELFGYEFRTFDRVITKGLDLQGGVSVLMEIQEDEVSKEDLEKTKSQLALRVNKIGVAETVVTTEGDKRIRIEIPGQYDSSSIVESLQKTGELTFKSPEGDVLLTGSDIEKAQVVTEQNTGEIQIQLQMNSDGKQKFAEATQKYIGKQISINLDEEQLVNPTVNTAITDGTAVITGGYTLSKAKNLTGLINAGALPCKVKAVSVQVIGAQLGADALPNALLAGAIGLALVFLFMIFVYRIPGFLSCIVLTLYTLLVLFVMEEIGTTLTLPGIAALLLTIGMAVDANVLIFERIREEVKKGLPAKNAVERGFENALSSIVDSNITTIIAAIVLYLFGTGSVKGFAVTLLIGVLVSLFTSLVITKLYVKCSVNAGLLTKPSHFRVKRGEE